MSDRTLPKTTPGPGRPARSLYRRVLGLGIAALVAAWLPFSVMYVSALHHPPAAITAVGAPRGGTRIVTTASGASRVVASSPNHGGSATAAAAPAPVSTHAS